MKKYKYSDVRDELNTGDIVLFSRKNVPMLLWQWFTDCRWTHVGMVIRSQDTQQVLLWESTTLKNLRGWFSGIAQAGVQAVLLSHRIRTYKGDVAFRKLVCPLDPQARRLMHDKLYSFRRSVQGRPFERNYAELLGAFIDISEERFKSMCRCACRSTGLYKDKGDDVLQRKSWSSIFCSELVAGAYQEMGLLVEADKKAKEYTPKDFSSDGRPPLKLQHGAELRKEKQIVCG